MKRFFVCGFFEDLMDFMKFVVKFTMAFELLVQLFLNDVVGS